MVDPSLQAFAGLLRIRPGAALPHTVSAARRDPLRLLAPGQPAAGLPDLAASLFSLCGHAHRLCARMAVDAALGASAPPSAFARRQLQIETLREHLRRLVLDWPRRLGGGAAGTRLALDGMADCPLPMAGAALPSGIAGLPEWIGQRLLGLPAVDWLAHWERDPAAWMARWRETASAWLPRLLRACADAADRPLRAAQPLRVHEHPAELATLAGSLRSDPAFARTPTWRGRCAETGPWTRSRLDGAERLDTPALRLGARLAELVRLSLPDAAGSAGAGWLACGAIGSGPDEGLAWIEMARGLLIHQVQLDGRTASARVVASHVVAPTEWNFHPLGAVARTLAAAAPEANFAPAQHAAVLLSAYDPCMRVQIVESESESESEPGPGPGSEVGPVHA